MVDQKAIARNLRNHSMRFWRSCWRASVHILYPEIVRDYINACWLTVKWVLPVPLAIFGSWAYFCLALLIPNPYRALLIWGFIAVAGVAVQIVNPRGRC